MSVRPLRPDTDRCLGEPLPHQLANQARAPLQAPGLAIPSFDVRFSKSRMSCGISVPFGTLSPTRRQVTHVLLTRLPLDQGLLPSRVRLACVRHAASVDSEPGSNSQVKVVRPAPTPHSAMAKQKPFNAERLLIWLLLRCSVRQVMGGSQPAASGELHLRHPGCTAPPADTRRAVRLHLTPCGARRRQDNVLARSI